MPRTGTHDSWERLVAAVLKKQQLWELFHSESISSSVSDASDFDSSFHLSSRLRDVSFDFSFPGDSSWRQQQPEVHFAKLRNSRLVFIHDLYPVFDLEDILNASVKMLGTGTFASAYYAELDAGVTFVIKKIKLFNIPEKDFVREMKVVGSIKHENVAAVRAYCFSKDEKLILYDHYSKGSVSALLHGETGENRTNVDWLDRLKIAVGAARGISHIHKQDGGRMVHGNIKASNILLDSQGYGCVSDLGLAYMITTKYEQNAFCYTPEIKSTRNMSQASDVYSFGILLLELVSRQSPVQFPSGRKAVDLVKYVKSVIQKNWNGIVYDGNLLMNPSSDKQIVRMLEIGLSCVVKSPKKRPNMSDVVTMIESIDKMNYQISQMFLSKMYMRDGTFVNEWIYGHGVYFTFVDGKLAELCFSKTNFTEEELEGWWHKNGKSVFKVHNVSGFAPNYGSESDILIFYPV